MTARKANDDSHFLFVPSKMRGHQTTTVREQTLENHIAATFSSCANLAQPIASVASSPDAIAPTVEAPAPFAVTVGATTHADLIFPPRSSFERRKIGKPSFDEREFGAGLLFLAMVIAPLLFVGLIVLLFVKT